MKKYFSVVFLAICVFFSSLIFVTKASAASGDITDFTNYASSTMGKGVSVKEVIAKFVNDVEVANNNGDANVKNLIGKDGLDATEEGFLVKIVGVDESTLTSFAPEERRAIANKYGSGAIGDLSKYISYTFSQPASSQTYIADVLNSAKIIPVAHAQGLGFSSLNPILEAWKIFRNIAYLFFVIIFLVIGFMIMFRQKIGGQAAITAQQAIPSIIVALLAVTFSYAIAGLLIDLMYVFMYLLIALFSQSGVDVSILDKNFIQIGQDLITGNGGAWDTVPKVIQGFVESATGWTGVMSTVTNFIGSVTVGLIMAVAILIGVFKLFFELLKTYVNLIATIVFAPLVLMFGAIPGNNAFGQWLKNVYGNLLAFPAVLMILIFYKTIVNSDMSGGGFMPPFMLGGGVGGLVPALVGLGMIIIMPEIVDKVKKAVGVTSPFEDLVNAAGANFKQGMPLGTRAAGLAIPGTAGAIYGGGKKIATGLLSGEGIKGIKWRNVLKDTRAGFDKGASIGIPLASRLSRSVGAQQPDILNPITKKIDDKYLDEEGKKRREKFQAVEDWGQMLSEYGGLGGGKGNKKS